MTQKNGTDGEAQSPAKSDQEIKAKALLIHLCGYIFEKYKNLRAGEGENLLLDALASGDKGNSNPDDGSVDSSCDSNDDCSDGEDENDIFTPEDDCSLDSYNDFDEESVANYLDTLCEEDLI